MEARAATAGTQVPASHVLKMPPMHPLLLLEGTRCSTLGQGSLYTYWSSRLAKRCSTKRLEKLVSEPVSQLFCSHNRQKEVPIFVYQPLTKYARSARVKREGRWPRLMCREQVSFGNV